MSNCFSVPLNRFSLIKTLKWILTITLLASNSRSRKASCSSQKDASAGQTAEEFFIDVILQRHARKLLSAFRLHDLVNHLPYSVVAAHQTTDREVLSSIHTGSGAFSFLLFPIYLTQRFVLKQVPRGGATLLIPNFSTKMKA